MIYLIIVFGMGAAAASDHYNDLVCNQAVIFISRQLILQIVQSDANVTGMANDTLRELEQVIIASYNNLSYITCDHPHFRRVENISELYAIDMDTYPSHLTESTSIVLQVLATCRNCTEYLPLFEDSSNDITQGSNTTSLGRPTAAAIDSTMGQTHVTAQPLPRRRLHLRWKPF